MEEVEEKTEQLVGALTFILNKVLVMIMSEILFISFIRLIKMRKLVTFQLYVDK